MLRYFFLLITCIISVLLLSRSTVIVYAVYCDGGCDPTLPPAELEACLARGGCGPGETCVFNTCVADPVATPTGGGGGGGGGCTGQYICNNICCSTEVGVCSVPGIISWPGSCGGCDENGNNCSTQFCCNNPPPTNGICAATHWNCTAGVNTDQYGGTQDLAGYHWECKAIQPTACFEPRCPANHIPIITSQGGQYSKGESGRCETIDCGGAPNFGYDNGSSNWSKACSCASVTCQIVNTPPTFTSLTVTNDVGTTLTASSNRYHICQQSVAQSANPRRMRFLINASDPQGGADITAMTLTWNGHNLPVTLQAANGNSRTGVAQVDFPDTWNNSGTFPLNVVISDTVNATASDSTQSLKVWNCLVPVSGNMYDSSDTAFGAVCASGVGFNTLASAAMNFTSVNVGATVWSASGGNAYSGGNLKFSYAYNLIPNADLMASGVITRWIDLTVGTTSCGTAQTLNSILLDPFAVSPRLKVDFSGIRNQEGWFQAKGGGIQAVNSVVNMVPITCANSPATCTAAMSIDSSVGALDSGLIAAATITNNSGCGSNCHFGNPNDWSRSYSTLSTNERYAYSYFYDRYFSTLGLGITLPHAATMSQVLSLGGTGVFLVNGDFNVDVDNVLTNGKFLMIVAKGTITFLNTANNSAGMFMGDAGIGTSPGINNALTINGILYSSNGNVRLNRGFANKVNNNTKPAVVVNYRPDLMFNMPGLLFRVLSNWKQF